MDEKTADITFFIIATSLILVFMAVLVINLLLVGRNRRLRHRNEVLEIKTRFENELMKTQVEVAENTLNDIARDLHDDIGQMLTFCIISINRMEATKYPDLSTNITEIRDSLQHSLQSVRNISKTLSHDYISSFGIYEALQRLTERVNRQGITTKFVFPRNILFKSKPNEVFAFRIVQELVNNTMKHAQAHNISIELKEQNDQVTLVYADDGKGLNVDTTLQSDILKNSMGFTNINKRSLLMQGSIQLISSPGNGFKFEITFPNV